MVNQKKYDKLKIISLDGSTVYKRICPTNRLPKLTALVNGKLDTAKFNGVLDESLDTDQLKEVYALHKGEMGAPYVEQGQYTRALVNVRFDYAVKEFEQYGRRYVRYGYDVSDADMTDHLCVWKVNGEPTLIAIEVPYEKDKGYAPVENPVDAELLGKYFEYDEEVRAYKRSGKAIPSAVKVEAIREELYRNGFDIDAIHYVRYKRSAGSSRDGRCLFIAEPLYKDMMEWSACGLSAEDAADQASWQAYIALTLSSIEKTIKLPKKAILIMQDKVSSFTDTAVCVKEDAEEGLVANEEETVIENVIWDGEALLDVSVFKENGYEHKGMMLLRNRFFKTCAFNTNLQKWFADRGVTNVKSLNGFTLARKIEDVKLVITESSLKYLKFMPKELSYADGFKRWLDAVYEGTNTSEFGVVKTDKPSPLMKGYMAYTNYQLLNTLAFTYDGVEMLLKQSFDYLDQIENDPVYLRHYLNRMSSAVEMDEEDELALDTYRQDTVLDMICRTPDFEQTDFYKCFRNDLVKRFKNKLRHGRIAVIGNYQTLFGNPYEFLLALVDKSYEPTESKLLGNEEIYNTMYMPDQFVLCARSPHITMGNLYVAVNAPYQEIDDYFNLTPNIVCVNAIRNNLQQRLNGCDYDSDSMLVTGDKWLVQALASSYKLMKVPVCKVNPCGKTEYTNTPESLAKLDIAIAENKIGEIVNLSQFLNCLLWDKLHNPNILEQNGYNNVRMLHSVNKDWDEDVKAMNGITPIKAESDETEAIRKLCREFILEAKELRKPPQLYNRICDVFTSIQNRMPHVNKEQIEKIIDLLLLLSKDECRKSLNEVSWDEIYEMLIREYIPHADNGNTEIRIRQIATDMNELAKVYEIPSMFNEIEIFTKPILKTAMDCIRLINYLERKEKPCKESKR